LLCGTLRPYQVSGMSWICRLYELGRNGILADEMGLGKTIQTIAAIAWLAERRQIWGPHLVVAPTSVVGNWVMEFQRWAPGLRVVAYTGSKKERAALRSGWTKPEHSDVVVTSYTLVLNDLAHLRRRRWVYLVVDEAHHIKNETSQAWRALMELPVLAKLLLTGTPFQNSLHELWSLLYFLSSSQEMRDRFTAEEWQAMTTPIADHAAAKRMIAGVHTLLRPYILRRLKSEVEQELPQKRYLIHVCPMSRMQRQLYTDFIAHHATRDKLQSRRPFSVIQCLAYLRQVCNHPYLITPPQPRSPVFLDFDAMPARSAMLERCFRIIDHTTAATAGTAAATAPPPPLVAFPTRDALLFDCGKLQVLAKLLARLRQTGHRCLIFTQMPRVLDLLELFLSASGYRYMRMDGSTPAAMRTTLVDGFNADPRFFCFILSTRSGGVGLNLTGADTVIFYDSDWNPAMDAQAQDRAHRIGQTREVTIYRLITAHSIEANILRKAEEKQRLSQLVIGAGHF
ncbi:hypothetical protein CXG81DRAFT_3624, partial [Caulochytrium protostelioides]